MNELKASGIIFKWQQPSVKIDDIFFFFAQVHKLAKQAKGARAEVARAGRERRARGRLLTLDSASAPTARWHRGVTAGPVPAASPAPRCSTCHRVPPPTWQPFKHGAGAREKNLRGVR